MKHLTQYILFESGSIGGNRILRADVKPTVEKYEKEVLQKFPGYKKCEITGSYNAGTKKDHGDIDLCIWIDSKEDIKNIKKEFKKHIESGEDSVVFVDPARLGLDNAVIEKLKSINPRKIVYMSCNPETCVRDIKQLISDNNYIVSDILPYDMFACTKHVEVLVCLQRQV